MIRVRRNGPTYSHNRKMQTKAVILIALSQGSARPQRHQIVTLKHRSPHKGKHNMSRGAYEWRRIGGSNINRSPYRRITFLHQHPGMYYSAVYGVQGTSKTGRTICHQNELCGLQKIIPKFAQREALSNFQLMCLFCVCVIFNFRSLLFDGRTSRGSLVTGVVSRQ